MGKLVEIDWNPGTRALRDFGFVAFVAFAGLSAMAWFGVLIFSFGLGDQRVPVSGGLLAIGVLSGVLSLVRPRANRMLYVGLSVLTYPIGFVLSYVIMGSLFFLLFLPLGILLRLLGRDSMRRRRDTGAASYWTPARPARKPESYFRQF